ncbi:MAG TPA: RluA family pseudouridine synthase [Clostridia bacterium]|nr:RluA family pseudouridine synthase [Clostridia bacterium]
MSEQEYPTDLQVTAEDAGRRLDQFVVSQLPDVSRVRVQQLLEEGKILVDGAQAKASLRLRGIERIEVLGPPQAPPLRATAEDIPLDVVYEDDDLAIINKPAGMLVHAGTGNAEDPRNSGTLVNALLHRFGALSEVNGELRPGIVHRLDKDTSGLIVVAKNDVSHRRLSTQFASREVNKRYIALVHGHIKQDSGTVAASISRDNVRRTRMTTKLTGGREAVSHYKVLERVTSPYGRFTLVEVKIETGRTHQIRVHLSSIGHAVVGDTLYGAPATLSAQTLDREARGNAISTRTEAKKADARRERPVATETKALSLKRNFLHAAAIELKHPRTSAPLAFARPLPPDLQEFLARLRA